MNLNNKDQRKNDQAAANYRPLDSPKLPIPSFASREQLHEGAGFWAMHLQWNCLGFTIFSLVQT